jgi:hypothetical protein
VSDTHWRKQLSHNISTDAGISIEMKSVSEIAYFSIRDNLGPDSNINEVSDTHWRKQLSPNISTDEE